jgi:hypothetical protein
MTGYPRISLLDAAGTEIAIEYRKSGDQIVTSRPPERVVLPPGGTAYMTLSGSPCVTGSVGPAGALELIPPDETVPLSLPHNPSHAAAVGFACGVGSVFHVSPVGADFNVTLSDNYNRPMVR